MEMNPTRMCELLVGLPNVTVLGVLDVAAPPLVIHIESRVDQGWCPGCGTRAHVEDRAAVSLVDLPCFGRQSRLVWHKRRWRCGEASCLVGTWTVRDPRIAAPRARLTDRGHRGTGNVTRRDDSIPAEGSPLHAHPRDGHPLIQCVVRNARARKPVSQADAANRGRWIRNG